MMMFDVETQMIVDVLHAGLTVGEVSVTDESPARIPFS